MCMQVLGSLTARRIGGTNTKRAANTSKPPKMKISKKSQAFENHPEHTGPAVCVDCTPPKRVETSFGPREQFKLVFETGCLRQDGSPFLVWSAGFTPSLHEKASLTKFLRQWFGRPLTQAEQDEFDTESLVGRSAVVTIVHNEGRDGQTYANIALIQSDKSGKPLVPSGKYVRVKDRPPKDNDAQYSRAEQPANGDGENAERWRGVKVCVGKHAGLDLGDLDRESVDALITHWMPQAKSKPKTTADERRLIAALEAALKELTAEADVEADNIPY